MRRTNVKMKEEARQTVKELVERFRYNLDAYKKSTYNEAQVRREFIDPFFEALGWDETRMERDKELYEWQIKVVDAIMDRLVYALYGLTEEEIKVVEEQGVYLLN